MTRIQMVAAACIFMFGLLIGLLARSDGPDLAAIDATFAARADALAARVEAAEAAQAERLAGLESQLAALSERLGPVESSARAGAEAAGGVAERLGAEIEGVARSLGDTIRNATAAQMSALEEGLAAMRAAGALDGSGREAPDPAPAALRLSTGDTAELADGALAIFVSRIDETGGRVLITVNDALADLAIGQSTGAEVGDRPCAVTLEAIEDGEAVLAQTCAAE